jgi:hypothetical protein
MGSMELQRLINPKACMGLRLNVETLTWDLYVKIGICFVCDHTLAS